MNNLLNIDFWGVMLIVIVSLQATVIAYLYEPRWKALVLSLPLPFTLATLTVGKNVDATNLAGLGLLLGYTHGVRLLRYRSGLPIVLAIVLPAFGYCLAGGIFVKTIPAVSVTFWALAVLLSVAGIILYKTTPLRLEPGHISPLPIWLKLPLIVLVILFIISIKSVLKGFVTMFPMVGVVTAYEARHSLWTMCRQIPVIILTMVPLMAICRIVQSSLGLGWGLALGWIGFLVLFFPLTKSMWTNDSEHRERIQRV